MSVQEAEAPPRRKKRRSKWDIQPEDMPTPTSNSHDEATPPQAPTSAAAAAAAKLNAKLASEGKLKPANTIYMPASSSVFSPSPLASSSPSPLDVPTPSVVPLIRTLGSALSTIDINDLDVREQLTTPATLTDINKTTGVVVAVRGKYLTPEENKDSSETPLHIHIHGPSQEKVDAAVLYINSLIRSLQQVRSKGGGALLSTPPIPPLPQAPPHHSTGPHYIQDKVFVGLDKAAEEFKVKERIEGIGGSFLGHIAAQTGAKVYLRGRGSGFIEPTSGRESFEAMYLYISHSTQEGITAARKLCESLIQTVQKDHEMWKRNQQPLGFGGQAPQYRPQYTNPYHRGGFPQPPYGPMPPGGGPDFRPPPPGAFPPPPPAYGFYPGPPMPPSQYPPGPGGPYGPMPPGGFGPPPPAEFQQPGPPYQPIGIPLPPSDPPSDLMNTSQPQENEGPPPVTSVSSGPTKRRFTEQVKSTNGLSKDESGPYWSQVAAAAPPPRRFTEGPPEHQKTTTETKQEPPPSGQSPNQTQDTLDQNKDDSGKESEELKEKSSGVEPTSMKVGSEAGMKVTEDSKLMLPPPGLAERMFVAPTMPPPSFIPSHRAPSSTKSSTPSTKSPVTPSTPPPPLSTAPSSPPPPSDPLPLAPQPPVGTQSNTAPTPEVDHKPPSPIGGATTTSLVAYGEDSSDSDLDG